MATTSSHHTPTPTPHTEPAPVWPAVDPVKLAQFNTAVANGARAARAAADCFEQYQLGRLDKAGFEASCHELLDLADDEFHNIEGLMNPPPDLPESLLGFDTYRRTTRDRTKPWPPTAA